MDTTPRKPSPDAPVTLSGLAKHGLTVTSIIVSVAISAFGWGVAWMSFQGRLDGVEGRVDKLEKVAKQPELTERLKTIEALVGELVCLDDRADRELCRRALSGKR